MSKGQKRSTREIKKPKQEKKPPIPVSTSILPSTKKTLPPITSKIK